MRPFAASLILLIVALTPKPAAAFRRIVAGEPIANRTMPTLDGKRAQLLAPGKVSVFVFVRTGHDFSESALRQLAQLEREQAGKPVHFAIVVSSSEAPADVARLIQESGIRAPVLVDTDDALYGELGVAMYPSGGIVGKDGRLAGFQPFRKVNYLDAMRGRVQAALGELDEAALARIIDPGVTIQPGGGRAHARLTLGRRLLAAGDAQGAISNARASIALQPGSADAHALLAEALATAGECDEAAKEAGVARQLSPSQPATALACARR